MPSPFPGMDPYLEDPTIWPDVHQRLITYIADALQPAVRPRYHVRIGERLYIAEPPRGIIPDVAIYRRGGVPAVAGVAMALAPDSPVLVSLPSEQAREVFAEIIDLPSGGQVVTVIEILSPTNKMPGKGHDDYKRKQKDVVESHASMIEMDFLRDGMHTLIAPKDALRDLPPWHYVINISRASRRDPLEVYAINLRQRLPRIPVPLAEPDPDVVLDLQAVFERCYENGAYADVINYARPAEIVLDPDDAAWANALLRERNLRN